MADAPPDRRQADGSSDGSHWAHLLEQGVLAGVAARLSQADRLQARQVSRAWRAVADRWLGLPQLQVLTLTNPVAPALGAMLPGLAQLEVQFSEELHRHLPGGRWLAALGALGALRRLALDWRARQQPQTFVHVDGSVEHLLLHVPELALADVYLGSLAACSKLETLHLRGCLLDESCGLERCTQLVEVHLVSCQLRGPLDLRARLAPLTRLTRLEFVNVRPVLGPAHEREHGRLPQDPWASSSSLCAAADGSSGAAGGLPPRLAELTLASSVQLATPALLALLPSAQQLTRLELSHEFGLGDNADQAPQALTALAALPQLKHLDLSNFQKFDVGLARALAVLTQLTYLDLSWLGVDEACLVELTMLTDLRALGLAAAFPLDRDADVCNTGVGLRCLLKRTPNLRALTLTNADMTADMLEAVVQTASQLEHLNISMASLPPWGLEYTGFPTGLLTLEAAECTHVRLLCDHIAKLRALTRLDISYAYICELDMWRLAQSLCSTLEALRLSGCDFVTAATVKMLLAELPHLVELDISECGQVTNEVVPIILADGARLQRLVVYGTDLTRMGRWQLAQSLADSLTLVTARPDVGNRRYTDSRWLAWHCGLLQPRWPYGGAGRADPAALGTEEEHAHAQPYA